MSMVPSVEAGEWARKLLDAVSDAMVCVDRSGRIMLANGPAESMFGYERHEMVGHHVEMLVPSYAEPLHPEHRERYFDQPWTRAMGSGPDLVARRADGSEFPVAIGLSPIETDEGPLAVATVRDLTERKKVEENDQRAHDALEAFSYGVTHDLRAPLRAIDGFARILAEDHVGELSPEGLRCLDRITESAARMGTLLEDLLSLARLGSREVRAELVDPKHAAEEAVADLAVERAERDVEIVVDEMPPCLADPGLLRVVFAVLLSNALKFTRDREHAMVHVGGGAIDGTTTYFVRDNGIGFDMRYADRLFGVFQRLHAQDRVEGTGVGLATARLIVERHGGRIWVEAEKDRGASFFFTLEEDIL